MILEQKKVYFIKGSGTSGCLCTGQLDDLSQFTQLKLPNINANNIKEIQLSGMFMIILLKNGQVFYCGTFDKQIATIPKPLQLKCKINQISCGWDHALIGSVQQQKYVLYGMGSNKFGEINSSHPRQYLKDPVIITQISIPQIQSKQTSRKIVFNAGFRQSYWSNNGMIYGCGQNKNYELGIQEKNSIMLPSQIGKVQGEIIKIKSGKKFVCFLSKQGDVYANGLNEFGCLDISNPPQQFGKYVQKPTKICQDAKDIECGWSHITIMRNDGQIISQGRNNFGQLGRDPQNKSKVINFPQKIKAISSGSEFSFAIGVSNTLYGWGWNEHQNVVGQLPFLPNPTKVNFDQNYRINRCITYPAITIVQAQLK